MGIEFPAIDPVAFALGPLEIRWYALAYLAGFILGWRYCLSLAGLYRDGAVSREHIDDFLPWAIGGVLLGGRLGYVLFYNFGRYADAPLDIFKIWEGGMAFHGGALGVIAALVGYSLYKKVPLLRLTDMIACVVPIGLFFGRIANFINGELYGRPADVPWAVKFPAGGFLPRHPSQLYEAALEGAVLFLILYALSRVPAVRERAGILSGVFLLGYGIFRALIENFREPDAQLGLVLGPLSMGQVLSLPMLLAGAGLVIYALVKGRKAEDGDADAA